MRPLVQRNEEIVRLYRAGESSDSLALRFRVSRSWVLGIVKAARDKQEREKRIQELHETIRQRNNLDVKWSVEGLFESLGLPIRFERAFCGCVQGKGKNELSLRDLMDMAVSSELPAPGKEYRAVRAFSVNNVGKFGARSIIKALSAVNWGDAFSTEWDRRLKVLESVGYFGDNRVAKLDGRNVVYSVL